MVPRQLWTLPGPSRRSFAPPNTVFTCAAVVLGPRDIDPETGDEIAPWKVPRDPATNCTVLPAKTVVRIALAPELTL